MANPNDQSKPNDQGGTPPYRLGEEEVLAAVPDMMFRISREGRYLGFKAAKGLEPFVPPSEFLGRRVLDVLPPAIAEGAMTCISAALATSMPQTYEYQLQVGAEIHSYEARIVALSPEDVLVVARDVTAGERPAQTYGLTPTELAILSYVTLGLADKEIANNRGIQPSTASRHVRSILRKMDARSRTEAAVRAVREGLLG